MAKPTQYEIDVTRGVLEYCIASMHQHEAYAINTINDFESTLTNIPNEDELQEVTDG